MADGALLRSFKAYHAALHPSGQIIATSDVATTIVTLWRVADGQQLQVITPSYAPRALAFSPDGQWLAVGSVHATSTSMSSANTGYVELWQLSGAAPQRIHTPTVTGIAINAVVFSPDGQLVAAAGSDVVSGFLPAFDFWPFTRWPFTTPDQIQLWRVADGAHLQTIYSPGTRLQFSPDGQRLYAAGADALYVWRVLPAYRWLRWAVIGGGLTALVGLAWWRGRRRVA